MFFQILLPLKKKKKSSLTHFFELKCLGCQEKMLSTQKTWQTVTKPLEFFLSLLDWQSVT